MTWPAINFIFNLIEVALLGVIAWTHARRSKNTRAFVERLEREHAERDGFTPQGESTQRATEPTLR